MSESLLPGRAVRASRYLRPWGAVAVLAGLATGACAREGGVAPVPYVPPVAAASSEPAGLAGAAVVGAPPASVALELQLSPYYTKYLTEGDAVIVASSRVADVSLLEVAYLIRRTLGPRRDVLRAMRSARVRFVVMAATEMTTDVPEHADLVPKAYWDRRARGVGATAERPATSAAEENLLDLPGDPYATENLFIHEFAHSVHQQGMATLDPSFDARLAAAYEHAQAAGLWARTYAMENRIEYWAEAAQSWFDCNRVNDDLHGPVDTREKVKAYDPAIAALLTEAFGDRPWRYQKPRARDAAERQHFANFDIARAGSFAWPARTSGEAADRPSVSATWLSVGSLPRATPSAATPATTLIVSNERTRAVSFWWVAFDGQRKHYADIRPGGKHLQSTYAGHVWAFTEAGQELGGVVADAQPSEVRVR